VTDSEGDWTWKSVLVVLDCLGQVVQHDFLLVSHSVEPTGRPYSQLQYKGMANMCNVCLLTGICVCVQV